MRELCGETICASGKQEYERKKESIQFYRAVTFAVPSKQTGSWVREAYGGMRGRTEPTAGFGSSM